MSSTSNQPLSSYAYDQRIGVIRFALALYVFFLHIIPRYAYFGHNVQPLLNAELWLSTILNGSNETNPAVILFLVLSGYCIHKANIYKEDFNLNMYLTQRFFRIVPLFVFGTVLGAMVLFWLQHDMRMQIISNTEHLDIFALLYKTLGLFAFIPWNFEIISHQGNTPLVTCGVELWLYIFYPYLWRLVSKFGAKKLFSTLLLLCVAAVVFYTKNPDMASWWHNGSIYCFLLYWWLGVYAVENKLNFIQFKTTVLLYLALSTVILLQPNWLLLAELRKISLAFGFAQILAGFSATPYIQDASTLIRNICAPSFSLYALHQPLIAVFLYMNVPFYLACALIVCISYMSFYSIEQPSIAYGRRLQARWRTAYA